MGVPMQSSLVQVPCKSGSPHGVFGGVQLFVAVAGFGAVVGAAFGACPKLSTVVIASTATDTRNGCFIFVSSILLPGIRRSFLESSSSTERIKHRVVALMARVFEIRIAGFLGDGERHSPRFRIDLRVIDGHLVIDRIRRKTR